MSIRILFFLLFPFSIFSTLITFHSNYSLFFNLNLPSIFQLSDVKLYNWDYPFYYNVHFTNETHTNIFTFVRNKQNCKIQLYFLNSLPIVFESINFNLSYIEYDHYQFIYQINNDYISFPKHLLNGDMIIHDELFHYSDFSIQSCKNIYSNSKKYKPFQCFYTLQNISISLIEKINFNFPIDKNCYFYHLYNELYYLNIY